MSKNILIPVRSLAELHIVSNFLNRFNSHIEHMCFTGDKIKFETKKNPFQDVVTILYETKYSPVNNRTFDIKSGNFCKGEYFKSEIRQITLDNGEIIWYPNKAVDLKQQHYSQIINRLNSSTFLNEMETRMDKKQFEYIKSIIADLSNLIMCDETYQLIEQSMMNIQTLSIFPKAFNFLNIHHISNKELTIQEISFLEKISQFVNPHILNNPRSMQQFFIKVLKIYQSTNDNHVFKTIKPLKTTQTWLSTELDRMGIDIFL